MTTKEKRELQRLEVLAGQRKLSPKEKQRFWWLSELAEDEQEMKLFQMA